jgi:hypothetical protein
MSDAVLSRSGDTSLVDLVQWVAILGIYTHWLAETVDTGYQNLRKIA